MDGDLMNDNTTNDIWKPIGPPDATEQWVGHDTSSRFPVYTRGNAGEVYPEVFTPLSFSIAADAGERSMRAAILASGLIRPDELAELPITTAVGSGVFGGYAYLNLSIQRTASARMPGGKAEDADVNFLGVGEPPPHVPVEGEKNWRASLAGLAYVVRLLRTKELPELAEDQRRVDEYLASLPPLDAPDAELADLTDDFMEFFEELFTRHLKISFAAGIAIAVLSNLCDQQLDDPDLAVQLLAGLGGVDSAAPSVELWKLSRLATAEPAVDVAFDQGVAGLLDRLRSEPAAVDFLESFDAFLARFGSRGPNEWDTAFDTWETNPELALTLIDRMRGTDDSHDPALQLQRLGAERATLEAATFERVPRLLRGIFRRALRSAQLFSQSRERTKTTVVRAIHGARLRNMELDRRLSERAGGQRGDLWFLVVDELDAYRENPASFRDVIAERRALHARLDERIPPFFFDRRQPPLDQWELRSNELEPVTAGEIIEGLPGCLGVATGRARVVLDPADPRGLEPGEILVAPLTDPSWTPLFVAADGVVVDVGAVMSHAVIVSRELGIPCAVSVTNATRRIPDGAMIEVDGSTGKVRIIDV
jgi:phosphohistidine swiveling domain-containing protein